VGRRLWRMPLHRVTPGARLWPDSLGRRTSVCRRQESGQELYFDFGLGMSRRALTRHIRL
jgi:hypothetical protein